MSLHIFDMSYSSYRNSISGSAVLAVSSLRRLFDALLRLIYFLVKIRHHIRSFDSEIDYILNPRRKPLFYLLVLSKYCH